MKLKCFVVLMLFLGSSGVLAFDHEHIAWDGLLSEHVKWVDGGHASQVDYAGFIRDKDSLQRYLDEISGVKKTEFESWPDEQKLSFLINAYNAFTVMLVIENWPVHSIRDIGGFFSGPWSQAFIPLFGESVSLDDIEHGMIRAPGEFDDERIHFAVNCASVGCPALRPEAFVASELEDQLNDSQKRFISDVTRNRVNCSTGDFEVSQIFKWYSEDFEADQGSVARWLIKASCGPSYSNVEADVKYLPYDWSLNSVPGEFR